MSRARASLRTSRERLLEYGLLVLFAGLLLLHLSRREGAPKVLELNIYWDHFRHLRYAWESASRGLGIYRLNTEDLAPIGDSRAYNWPHITYFYPPAALLLSMPAAQLAYRGIISFDAAANFMTFVFGMAAAFLGVRVWRQGARLTGTFEGSVVWGGVAFILFQIALSWGLRGQYDGLVVALLLIAGGNRTRAQRLVLLGLAFGLKFQALVCLPFFALDLLAEMRDRRLFKPATLVACVLTASSLATAVFLGATGRLALAKQSPFNFVDFPRDRVTFVCVLFTLAFILVATVRWRVSAAATALWVFAAFASLSVLQAWYVMYFFGPVFLLNRRSQPWFGVWVVGLLFVMRWWPDAYYTACQLFVINPT